MSIPVISSIFACENDPPPKNTAGRTSDGVLDLDSGVDLDEVVATLLVHQELCGSSVPVADTLRELDSIRKNRLPDFLRQMSGRRNFHDLLMPPLHGAVALKQVDRVSLSISEDLHFDVTRSVQEPLNEHRAISKSRLRFRNCSLERGLEFGLITDNTHPSTSSAHRSLDDNFGSRLEADTTWVAVDPLTRETILLHERSSVLVLVDRTGCTRDDRNADLHRCASDVAKLASVRDPEAERGGTDLVSAPSSCRQGCQ